MSSLLKNILFFLLLSCHLLQASEFSHADDNPEAAAIALATFQRINTAGNWCYPNLQEDGTLEELTVSSKHWRVNFQDIQGIRKVPYLEKIDCVTGDIMSRISLGDAFEDLLNKPAVIECTMTQAVVIAMCANKILDPHLARLDSVGKKPVLSAPMGENEVNIFSLFTKKSTPFSLEGNAPLGSFGYITNIDHYHSFQPHGLAAGFNVACVGRNNQGLPLFMGFDPDKELFDLPRTFAEVQRFLYQETLKPIGQHHNPKAKDTLESLQAIYKENFQWFQEQCGRTQKKYPAFTLKRS